MRSFIYGLFFFTTALLLNSNVFATHIMGADISYTWVSGTTYTVRVAFYRNCGPGAAGSGNPTPAPSTITLNVKSVSCGYNTNYTVPFLQSSGQDVSPVCGTAITACDNPNANLQGVSRNFYDKTITLPANCTDWVFSWEGLARNATISTLNQAAQGDPLYVAANLNSVVAPGNTSPVFSSLPVPYFCAGQATSYNHGAYDANGDSLVYSIVDPLVGATNPVTFLNPYNATYPIATTPSNNFVFNSLTGQMTFTPSTVQLGVTAVRVDEYRNGQLIGSVTRDIQLVVLNCNGNSPVTVAAPSNITGATSAGNNTFKACVGTPMTFKIIATDPNSGTNIGMTTNLSTTIPGASFTSTGTNPKTGTFTWTPTSADIGYKVFALSITDNACPIPSTQVIGFAINVYKVDLSAPDFTVCPGVTSTIQLNASISGGIGCPGGGCITWTPSTGLSSTTIATPTATVSNPINYTVTYTDGVCTVSDVVQILPAGGVVISPQDTAICLGKTAILNAPNTFPSTQTVSCGLNNVPCSGSVNIATLGTDNTTTLGTGTANGVGTPFQGAYNDGRVEYLFLATELSNSGLVPGLLNSISFNITDHLSSIPYSSFYIKVACTNLTSLNATTGFNTTATQVYAGIVIPTLGTNTFNFSTPFQWNGTSNIIIQVCYHNTAATDYDHVTYSATTFNSVLYSRAASGGCSLGSPTVSTKRPNVQFSNCSVASPVTYTWTSIFGNPISSLSNSTTAAPGAHPNDTTIYVVTVSNGTCTVRDTATVYTYPASSVNPLPSYTTCPGDTIVLTATGTNIAFFTWSNGLPAGPTVTVAPLNTITYTVIGHTLNCGNIPKTSKITVVDSIAPIILNCPPNVVLYSTPTTCDLPYSWTTPTFTDNCPRTTMTQTAGPPSGSIFPVGTTTITYDAVDLKANHTLCTFNIQVKDTIKPVISGCPANIVVNSNVINCKATVSWIPPTVSDNCPNPTLVQVNGPPNGNPNFIVGVNTVKYKATDASGNISYCTFTVTVIDVQPPTIVNLPANIVVGNDSNQCAAVVSWIAPTATDNCTGVTVTQTGGIANGGVFPLGTSVVTYTATDGAGNTDIDSFTVTVNDVQVPNFFGCLSDTIVGNDIGQCTAVFSWLAPTATDNCPGFVTITQIAGPPSGSVFPPGNTYIAYAATDLVGNADTCGFTITVTDLENPIISNCPANITIPKDTNLCGGVVTWIEPTATDNCGTLTLTQVVGLPSGSFFPLGPTNIIYVATDSAGNTDTCQFVVFVTDGSFPIINGCPTNITVSNDIGVCGAFISWIDPSVTDNCPGATIVVTQGLPNNSVFPIGTTTIIYTATDAALNVVTCSFTVTVSDTEFPVIANCPANIIVGNDLNRCDAVVNWIPPTPSDNCPNFTMTSNYVSGDTFALGTTQVLYIIVDSVGNSDSCTFSITVNDVQGPLITNCPDSIVQSSTATSCDAIVTWIPPTIADNCSGFTVVHNYSPGDTFPSGVTTVTYTATDTVGNVSTCSFTVTINDSIPPVITGCPANITINTNGNCQAIVNWIAPTATDNCPVLSFTSNSFAPGDTFPLGITNVIYIAVDGVGNADTCTFSITVIDSIPPVITNCPANIVYQLTTRCDTTIDWTPPSFSDNCVANIFSNFEPNDTFSIGVWPVVYVAIDSAGNTDTCKFSITVTPPNPLVSAMTINSDVHCLNGNDGQASVAVTGGSGSYIYSWTSTPSQNTDTAFMLNVGTYYVYISDSLASGCVNPIIDTVTISQLPVLDVVTSGTNPTCFGFSNGDVLGVASYGTPAYSYSWSSGQLTAAVNALPAGAYTLYVTDSYNCIDSASITLTQPDSLSGIPSQTNVDCKGFKTGAASIVMSGGTTPYQYQWSDAGNSIGSSITNVFAGTYNVTVTDAQNCVYSHNFTITEPNELLISIDHTEVICHNSATATATVNIQGGTTPYNTSWNTSPPQTTITATNLAWGVYQVVVTDSQGCHKQKNVVISNPPVLSIRSVEKTDPYCDWPNGTLSALAAGGIPGYVYTWNTNPVQTTSAIDSLYEGDYQLTVTDTRGCSDTLNVTLTNTPPATPSFTSIPSNTEPILLSHANIQFQNTSTGAAAYSWNFGDTQATTEENPKHSFYETQTYTVTLTAYNDYFVCPTTYSLDYEIIFDGAVYTPNVFTPNNDGNNDVFSIIGAGLVELDWIIYDRWGKEIYHARAVGDTWDGTKDGMPVPEGTYTYIMRARLNDGSRLEKGGTVIVVR